MTAQQLSFNKLCLKGGSTRTILAGNGDLLLVLIIGPLFHSSATTPQTSLLKTWAARSETNMVDVVKVFSYADLNFIRSPLEHVLHESQ
jgi:hypothetical protein